MTPSSLGSGSSTDFCWFSGTGVDVVDDSGCADFESGAKVTFLNVVGGASTFIVSTGGGALGRKVGNGLGNWKK